MKLAILASSLLVAVVAFRFAFKREFADLEQTTIDSRWRVSPLFPAILVACTFFLIYTNLTEIPREYAWHDKGYSFAARSPHLYALRCYLVLLVVAYIAGERSAKFLFARRMRKPQD